MAVDIVSVAVNIGVALVAAFLGVVVGTHYERKRAKAERLYDLKRGSYTDIIRNVSEVPRLWREVASLADIDISEEEIVAEEILADVQTPLLLSSRELMHLFFQQIQLIGKAQTSAEKRDHARLLSLSLFSEGLVQLNSLGREIDKLLASLELVDIPSDVRANLNRVNEVIFSALGNLPSGPDEGIFEERLSPEYWNLWESKISSSVNALKISMKNDLDATL